MNIRVFVFGLLLVLAGCQSPLDDMLNNNFAAIKPQKMSEKLTGNWTGNMGPYLTTLSFKNDGYGLFCYSYGTADVLQKVKYSNDTIFIQDGTKLEIVAIEANKLIVNANYFGGNESTLYSDNELKEASEFCSSKLSM